MSDAAKQTLRIRTLSHEHVPVDAAHDRHAGGVLRTPYRCACGATREVVSQFGASSLLLPWHAPLDTAPAR